MNNKQKLFSCISGFELNAPFTSAQDDYYYDLIDKKASYKDRVEHLQAYAGEYVENMDLITCCEVDCALINKMSMSNSNDVDHLYISLGDD